MKNASAAIHAQAKIHHAFLLGLQLKIASQFSPEIIEQWMFQLFRRQHEEKFLSSFNKLNLEDLPDAVACAQYHVLSNSIGGVAVEFMPENDSKAWVRFRYPRWMYDGPTVCGLPVEVSRGFLKGWYAQNGVSLKNPRLGFVCVSEDMTGQFGLCGYFKEYDHELSEDQRLQFAPDEVPPPFNKNAQPKVSTNIWTKQRLEKANRNYALDYMRNGLVELAKVIGVDDCVKFAGDAAYLIGLQYMQEMVSIVEASDGGSEEVVTFLETMMQGLDDSVEKVELPAGEYQLKHRDLRILRGIDDGDQEMLLRCWHKLWLGMIASFQQLQDATAVIGQNEITWTVKPKTAS